jgi:hypothetical protein
MAPTLFTQFGDRVRTYTYKIDATMESRATLKGLPDRLKA